MVNMGVTHLIYTITFICELQATVINKNYLHVNIIYKNELYMILETNYLQVHVDILINYKHKSSEADYVPLHLKFTSIEH